MQQRKMIKLKQSNKFNLIRLKQIYIIIIIIIIIRPFKQLFQLIFYSKFEILTNRLVLDLYFVAALLRILDLRFKI